MKGNNIQICDRVRSVVKSCTTIEQLEIAIIYCERLITKYNTNILSLDIVHDPRKILKVNIFLKRKQLEKNNVE